MVITSIASRALAATGPASVVPPIVGSPAGITPGAAFETKFASMTTSQQQAVISQMKGAGVHWLRLDVPATFVFNSFVQVATASGIKVDAILQAWNTPLNPSAFSRFAIQAVQTLKALGVETYEILNEPNCAQYCLSASSYTRILQASYRSIKGADPASTVLTGGMAPNTGSNEPYNYLTSMYQKGAGGYFDAFNLHPYSFPDTPLQTSDTWNPWSYLPQLHAIMAANGDSGKQIWLTEFGCPMGTDGGYTTSCTDSTLAAQITDAFNQARSWTWTGPLFVYDWQDDPNTSGDGDFGLYYADGTSKTAALSAFELEAGP